MADDVPYTMPRPAIGDIVLFSTDIHSFSNPVLGFVVQQAGDSTIRVLTFTPHGWVDRPSVHHKDDPAIHGDHGWDDLGVWQFAPITEAVYKGAAVAKEKLAHVGSK